jgi:serpin B
MKNAARTITALAVFTLVLPLAACAAPPDRLTPVGPEQPADDEPAEPTTVPDQGGAGGIQYARADAERDTTGAVDPGDIAELAADNAAFAVALYHAALPEGENAIFSPFSISLALAMAYGGAQGATAEQMASALSFSLPSDRLHPAFNALDQELSSLDQGDLPEDAQPFRLNIANAIWGQSGYPFEETYLDLLARNYGAGLQLVDYLGDAEGARQIINRWVEDQTEDRIRDLIPAGALNPMTRLVLTNAIYFFGAWSSQFEEEATQDAPFTLLDGSTVDVPMMRQSESFGYYQSEGFTAASLPYDGYRTAMAVLLPDEGGFEEFEAALDAEMLQAVLEGFQYGEVDLMLPRFEFESSFGLADALRSLGMTDAFDPDLADFSGIVDPAVERLFISDVIHKAFVRVDEQGTEAAAATAVVFEATSAMPSEPVVFHADRPFIFVIYEQETGAVLFMGRVVNPAS